MQFRTKYRSFCLRILMGFSDNFRPPWSQPNIGIKDHVLEATMIKRPVSRATRSVKILCQNIGRSGPPCLPRQKYFCGHNNFAGMIFLRPEYFAGIIICGQNICGRQALISQTDQFIFLDQPRQFSFCRIQGEEVYINIDLYKKQIFTYYH